MFVWVLLYVQYIVFWKIYTITYASHTNISAIPTTMNRKTNLIAVSSTGTAKHWKWCTWHRKASAKNWNKWRFCTVKWIYGDNTMVSFRGQRRLKKQHIDYTEWLKNTLTNFAGEFLTPKQENMFLHTFDNADHFYGLRVFQLQSFRLLSAGALKIIGLCYVP